MTTIGSPSPTLCAMAAFWIKRGFDSLKAQTGLWHWAAVFFPCLILVSLNSVAIAQGGASSVTKSFDFRNGALGWQAGLADYPPATDKDGFYELKAEIRALPPEIGSGTG